MDPSKFSHDDVSSSSWFGYDEGEIDNEMSDQTETRASSSSRFSIAHQETKLVVHSKIRVLIVLAITACACSYWTYWYTQSEENDDFTNQFQGWAAGLSEMVEREANTVFDSIKSLSATVASQAKAASASFPYFSVEEFENLGRLSNKLSLALQVSYVPLITNLSVWNKFADLNQDYAVKESNDTTSSGIFEFNESGERVPVPDERVLYAPVWQQAPSTKNTTSIINFDLLSHSKLRQAFETMVKFNTTIISEVLPLNFLYGEAAHDHFDHPHSFLLEPIYGNNPDGPADSMVGFLVAILPWERYFSNLFPKDINGLVVVLYNSRDDTFTYRIDGRQATLLGKGDLHDPQYDQLVQTTSFGPGSDVDLRCVYDLRIYPSRQLELQHKIAAPFLYASMVAVLFVFTAFVFCTYDRAVSNQQQVLLTKATRANKIVADLFPKNVRNQILNQAKDQVNKDEELPVTTTEPAPKHRLRDFLGEDQPSTRVGNVPATFHSKPIAELFTNTTVMFADICGFTAWSSVREPDQVFVLLESLYHAFDSIASRRRVFKVETIGDCYVAVAGLPDPRADHAVVMARFARDCLHKSKILLRELETILGPAGVLRGNKGRFQLFGDTVNTASRLETTGEPNRIHVSSDTASELIESGKENWVVPRADVVSAKGKGDLRTFWLKIGARSSRCSISIRSASSESNGFDRLEPALVTNANREKLTRLIDWNVEVLSHCIRGIVAGRRQMEATGKGSRKLSSTVAAPSGGRVRDEIVDYVDFPSVPSVPTTGNFDAVELDPAVIEELRAFVTEIAARYRNNPFHNFEHASHVAMSVKKLVSRVVRSTLTGGDDEGSAEERYGISNDMLTRFACKFSALIHDVDHSGVPNAQLIKEGSAIAARYGNESVAEQNSVDLAWTLLLSPQFANLQAALWNTHEEQKRIRQLVVNCVMATDLKDKKLKDFRNRRWTKAFTDETLELQEVRNRKATIVIEHLIQASDVAHTMQHWHVYRKWNERLFEEMMLAYTQGRSDSNPADTWYEGEIGFFDHYIIPLAKKLKSCGVFGVSCDELLSYAESNRAEWVARGHEVVAEMVQSFQCSLFEESSEDLST